MRGRMFFVTGVLVAAVLVVSSAGRAGETPAASAMQAQNAADLKWVPADALPPGAMMAVIHQNAATGGVDFLMKVGGDYHVPPHWHTPNELVTVVDGTFITDSKGIKHTLTKGGYMYLPGKTPHEAWCKGGCMLQVSGDGPFDVIYVNPADEPATYKAMKEKAAKEKKE